MGVNEGAFSVSPDLGVSVGACADDCLFSDSADSGFVVTSDGDISPGDEVAPVSFILFSWAITGWNVVVSNNNIRQENMMVLRSVFLPPLLKCLVI